MTVPEYFIDRVSYFIRLFIPERQPVDNRFEERLRSGFLGMNEQHGQGESGGDPVDLLLEHQIRQFTVSSRGHRPTTEVVGFRLEFV